MTRTGTTGSVFVAALLLLTVAGCGDQVTSVTLHEPGQYKGAHDPLLDVAGTTEFNQKLQQRLQQVQTDR